MYYTNTKKEHTGNPSLESYSQYSNKLVFIQKLQNCRSCYEKGFGLADCLQWDR